MSVTVANLLVNMPWRICIKTCTL